MNLVLDYLRELRQGTRNGWNRFWFTPTDPATLCLIRVLAGAMLLYTHLVWTIGLEDFFTADGWLSPSAVATLQGPSYAWSHFWLIESRTMLWTAHLAALAVFALFALGLFSRVTAVLAYLLTVAYANRVPGALFGLDQINAMLAMYLMLGPCGARYSLDRLLAARRATKPLEEPAPSVGANVAIRLIQLHMCIIYAAAGLTKLMGPTWWDGTAMWGAIANLEYQSIDMTWLVHYPLLVNAVTHLTLAWEISYCALVWPRLTRPIMLFLAIPVHLGIALCLGMMTFGLIMLVGNLAFVSPALVRYVVERRPLSPSDARPRDSKKRRPTRQPKAEPTPR